ncbi:hypothetical protein AB0I81_40240 [Nonomuraea sp. NPDC050404]|uniref:hypothetical protein n=1 Tax=Nonomuraea sp. NPDC050404 TaxID=3155783 RepID=UPI0033CD1B60
MPWDPNGAETFGAYMRGKSLQVHGGRSAPQRREFRDESDRRRREVTEITESGAVTTVTNRTDERGGAHQDVHVRAPVVRMKAAIHEPA